MTSNKFLAVLEEIKTLVDQALQDDPRSGMHKAPRQSVARPVAGRPGHPLSFDMSVLAFMKKYAGGLSGPQKFTLLVARLVKGSTTATVPYKEIEAQWNKMTTVLGAYNAAHSYRAKANGWLDSEQKANWKLTNHWQDAIKKS